MRRIAFICVFGMFLASQCLAMNGIGVYGHWWWPFTNSDQCGGFTRGTIVKATIQNNKVIQRDTIFKDVGQYPALSFDGKRVAFFRWGRKVKYSAGYYSLVSGTASNPNYISVMNIDGTGLQDLIQIAAPCSCFIPGRGGYTNGSEGNAVLDWPAGDWIYYEKPTKSLEIWRVNTRVPSRNEKLCSYNADEIRRWNLSLDARYAGCQVNKTDVGCALCGGSAFPLVNNDISQTPRVHTSGCNHTLSCGGNFIALYEGGEHTTCAVRKWNHSTNTESSSTYHTDAELEQWMNDTLHKPGYGGADLIRWSANSEKWVMRQIGWCWQADWMTMGTNCVAVNWKDKQAINLSHTKMPTQACTAGPAQTPPSDCAEAGDLWVDLGAGNENKWEDETGALHTQAPIDPVGILSGSGPGSAYMLPRISGHNLVLDSWNGYRVSIMNALGKTVKIAQGRGVVNFDLGSLRPGAYCITGTANGRSFSLRFTRTL